MLRKLVILVVFFGILCALLAALHSQAMASSSDPACNGSCVVRASIDNPTVMPAGLILFLPLIVISMIAVLGAPLVFRTRGYAVTEIPPPDVRRLTQCYRF